MVTRGTCSLISYVLLKNGLDNCGGNNATQVVLLMLSSLSGARENRRWQLSRRLALCVFEYFRLVEPCLDCICL